MEVGPSLPTNPMTLKMASNGSLIDPALPVKTENITVRAPLVAASSTKSVSPKMAETEPKQENITEEVTSSSLVEQPITTNKTDEGVGLCTQEAVGEVQSSSQVVVIAPAAQFETAPEEQQAIAASLAAQFETAPEEQQAIAASLAAQFETAPEEQQAIAASLAADFETPADEAIADVVQTLATLSTDEPPKKKIKIEGPDLQSEEEQAEGSKGKATKKIKTQINKEGYS